MVFDIPVKKRKIGKRKAKLKRGASKLPSLLPKGMKGKKSGFRKEAVKAEVGV